jgi:hypothetical protein
MVTAASLYAKYNGEKYLYTKDSLGETAIGVIPKVTEEEIIKEALQSDEAIANVDIEQSFDPLVHAPSTAEVDDSEVGAGAVDALEVNRATNSGKASKPGSKKSNQYNFMWLWLPLTFRNVPKKVSARDA